MSRDDLGSRVCLRLCTLGVVLLLAACGSDDPEETGGVPDAGSDALDDTDAGGDDTDAGGDDTDVPGELPDCAATCELALVDCGADLTCDGSELLDACEAACEEGADAWLGAALSDEACGTLTELVIDALGERAMCRGGACEPLATDYGQPDAWPACVSDGGSYVQVQENVSSVARISAFERIADLLWRRDDAPSPDDFLAARDEYSIDEGLDSRVMRREDEHLPPVVDGDGNTLRCRDEGVPALDPDRCVGPGQLGPLITDAFQRGIQGESPLLHAARIEAALTWFLYISSHKEAVTCTVQMRDCDSAWAYYGGGTQREGGIGLAGYVQAVAPESHERVFDGLLAVRCWRDLDNGEEATDLALRDRAVEQLDTAMLHGVARILADRALTLPLRTGEARVATWEFVKIIGGFLVRGAAERDAALGAELASLVGGEASDASAERIAEVALAAFACP